MRSFYFILALIIFHGFAFGQTRQELTVPAAQSLSIDQAGSVLVGSETFSLGEVEDELGQRGFLRFDLSSLPEGASVLSARLQLHLFQSSGEPAGLGALRVDMSNGLFAGEAAFQPEDYDAQSGLSRAAIVVGDQTLNAVFDARARRLLAPTESLCFRLYFETNGQADGVVDNLQLHGSSAAAHLQPTLALTYSLDGGVLEPVTLTLDPLPAVTTTAEHTVSGSVSPTDALVLFGGVPVEIDENGQFEFSQTLHAGTNDLVFLGLAYPFDETRARATSLLDTLGPVIAVTTPDNNFHTSEGEVSISGRVDDQLDREPVLTRDGVVIPLNNGRFVERDLPLANGTHTFTYEAVDAAGNAATPLTITVFQNDVAPAIAIDVPDHVGAGQMFDLGVSFSPADKVSEVQVFSGNAFVFEQKHGSPIALELQASQPRQQDIRVQARDLYGNVAESEAVVIIGDSHFLEGRLLDNRNSLPLAGVNCLIRTPLEERTLTSDAQGRFQAYLQGSPVSFSVEHPDFLTTYRFKAADTTGISLSDIRLSAKADTASGSLYDNGFVLTHLAGGALVRVDGQGLPALLPLGYSPVIAAWVPAGEVRFSSQRSGLPAGARLALLRQEGNGWRVKAWDSYSSGSFTRSASASEAGVWLLALADQDLQTLPEIEALIQRQSYQEVPLSQVRGTTIFPAAVSVLDTPQTSLDVSLSAGNLPSGIAARVRINEFHQHFNQSFSAPQDEVALFAYRIPNQFQENRLSARAEFHTRETVDPDLTVSAEMVFQAIDAPRFTPQFPENQIFSLGELTLDFNGTSARPLAMDLHPLLSGDRPMAQRTSQLSAFSLWIGGQLDQAPRITYSGSFNGSSMALLQRFNQNQWALVCLLRPNGEVWENNIVETDLRDGGDFMLVSMLDAVTEIKGHISDGGQPVGGALVSGNRHPWYGRSDITGNYRFFSPQSLMDLTLTALDPVTQKTAEIEHGPTEDQTLLDNQNFLLSHPRFSLLYHQPGAGERFIQRFPKIQLGFNQPLTLDQTLIQNAVTLEGPGGTAISLTIVQDRDQQALSITPNQSLQPQTEYTLNISSQLETLYGAAFSEDASFSFFTRDNQVSAELDLSRFYLTETNDQLVINGPESSFPAGTRLIAVNEATAESLSWILNGSTFSGPISGRAGHVINLEATAPDGTRVYSRLDVVRLGEDSWRLGSGAFALEWEDGTRLNLDEIQNGQGKEVTIVLVDNETAAQTLNNVEVLGDIASRAITLRAVKISTNDGSPLPTIAGRISAVDLPDPGPDYTAHALQLAEVVMPIHPDTPDQLATFTLANMLNTQSLAEENENLKRNAKYSLIGLSMSFLSTSAYDSSTYSTIAVASNDVMTDTDVYCFRPRDLYPGPYVDIDGEIKTGVPTQVYTTGSLTSGTPLPLCVTDSNGFGSFIMTGSHTGIQARDPVTGETKESKKVRFKEIEFFGEVLWATRTDHIEFTKTIEGAEFNLPILGVYIQGGYLIDGEFVEATQAREELKYNMINYKDGLHLRVVLASDEDLPGAELLSSRLPQIMEGIALSGEPIPNSDLVGRFSFIIPPSALEAPGRMEFTINAHEKSGSAPATPDEIIGTEVRALTIYTPGTAPGDSLPGPPMVTEHFPEKNGIDFPSDLQPVLTFNEPVTGLESGVRLYDSKDFQVEIEIFAGTPQPLTDTDQAVSITVAPRYPLNLGEKYTLKVGTSVKDLDNNSLHMGGSQAVSTFELKFSIKNLGTDAKLNEGFGYVGTMRYRNLMLVYQGDTDGKYEFDLDLYDLRGPKPKPRYKTLNPLKAPPMKHPIMALFTPKDLSRGNKILGQANNDNYPINDLPRGSVLLLFGSTHHSLNYLQLNKYLGSGRWQHLFSGHPAPGGVLRNFSSLGPYLAMPFSASNFSNAEIMDLRAFLKKIEDRKREYDAGDITQSNYLRSLNVLPFVTGYPLPHAPYDADLFMRNAGIDSRPILITSGQEGPAMYDFTPGNPSLKPDRSDRLLAETPWPDGQPGSRHWVGHAKNQRLKLLTGDVFGDVALFSRQMGSGNDGEGSLLIYRVPTEKVGLTAPLAEVIFPKGLPLMAVDAEAGLVAVVSGEYRLNVLSIRQLVEEAALNSGSITMDFRKQDLYLIPYNDEPVVSFKRMDFIDGIVSGVESSPLYRARVIPIIPKSYRLAGFEYYALDDWMVTEEGFEGETRLGLEHADTMVYYAQDLVSAGSSEFVMEMGTFDLDLKPGEKAEVTIREVGGDTLKVYKRPVVYIDNLQTYNLTLADYFTAEVQNRLRGEGAIFFEVTYKVTKGLVTMDSDTHTFAVSYLAPQSFGDSSRFSNGLDLLTGRPEYSMVDFAFSSGDPRNDLSIGRAYNGTTALEFGEFGMGMVDTRALRLAMPIWWNPADILGKPFYLQFYNQEIHFQHPGIFDSRVAVRRDSLDVYGLNQQFEQVDGHWVLTMGDQFKYTFGFDADLPNITQAFLSENQPIKNLPDAYDRIRYPVIRKRPEGKVPPTFMGTVLMETQEDHWGSHLKFEDAGEPSLFPSVVTQKVNDLGGERAVDQEVVRLENGRVVETITAVGQDPGLAYEYDEYGYLIKVTRHGYRTRYYQWEAVNDFELGDIPVKRLVKVTQGNEFTQFSYHEDRPFAVQSVQNPLGTYTITQTQSDSGLAEKAETSALGPVPKESVTFGLVGGNPLTTGYQIGAKSYTREWERIYGSNYEFTYLPSADSYLNQSWDYDSKGRILSYTVFERITTFKYDNPDPFEFVPTEQTDAEGNVFTITTDKKGRTIESGNHKKSVEFSGSGEIKATEDLYGKKDIAAHTTFYIPSGSNYVQRDGRLVQIPNPDHSTAWQGTYNEFGELTREIVQGLTTEISGFDDLGRPGSAKTADMPRQTISYLFKSLGSATYRVTRLTYDGLDSWDEVWVDDLGRVGFEISHLAGATHTTSYTHDDLSRVIEIQLNGSAVQTITYLGDSDYQSTSSGLGREVHYDRNADGTLNSVNTIIGGVSRQETLTTNKNDQVVSYEMPGQGLVINKYNGFGLLTEVGKAGAGGKAEETLISYSHEHLSVVVDNHISRIQSRIGTSVDGRNTEVRKWGAGLDASIWMEEHNRVLKNQGNFGFTFEKLVRGLPEEYKEKRNAAGFLTSQKNGAFQVTESGETTVYGQPRGLTGTVSSSQEFDAYGRVTGSVNPHGDSESYFYDDFGRIAAMTDRRSSEIDFEYFSNSLDLKSLAKDGPNVQGVDKLKVFERNGLADDTQRSWLGGETTSQTISEDESQTSRKGRDGNEKGIPAKIEKDPDTGRVSKITNHEGEVTNIYYDDVNLVKTIEAPGKQPVKIRYDGLGNVRTVTKGQVELLDVKRDRYQRNRYVKTRDHHYDYRYEGNNLTALLGGDDDIRFEEHTDLGAPGLVKIGNHTQIEISYHPGGRPRCITHKPSDGLPSVYTYNALGDLVTIQRGMQKPVHLTYNVHGAPASVQIGENAPTKLFDGEDPNRLQLPGGVEVTLTETGKIESVQHPGLVPKTYQYDAADRMVQILLDGIVQETFEYEDAQLKSRVSTDADHGETQTFEYDGRKRLKATTSDLDGSTAFTYNAGGEGEGEEPLQSDADLVKTYTDPNGVTYHYEYDQRGRFTSVQLQDGPSFHYTWNEAGQQTSVVVADMAATFDNYEKQQPTRLTWQDPLSGVTDFTREFNEQDRLTKVSGGPFELTLHWNDASGDAECGDDMPPQPNIEKVERGGPDFSETWDLQYDEQQRLTQTTITRRQGPVGCSTCSEQVIEELYGAVTNQLQGGLNRTVNGVDVLNNTHILDENADSRCILATQTLSGDISYGYDNVGNLTSVTAPGEDDLALTYDGRRRLRTFSVDNRTTSYGYDLENRRVRAEDAVHGEIVYAWHDSRPLAIGFRGAGGRIHWTHAFGHGPTGLVFVKDLSQTGNDFFIFNDHLGTPFVYRQSGTNRVFYTPYNPWGELLGQHPGGSPSYGDSGVQNQGFRLPPDSLFPTSPIGLAGHLYDYQSGFVYMHNRFYHPRLGHFINPDFRTPDYTDPSTVTEPYAYASGNPIMFWDPDGLAEEPASETKGQKNPDLTLDTLSVTVTADVGLLTTERSIVANWKEFTIWNTLFDWSDRSYNMIGDKTLANVEVKVGLNQSVNFLDNIPVQANFQYRRYLESRDLQAKLKDHELQLSAGGKAFKIIDFGFGAGIRSADILEEEQLSLEGDMAAGLGGFGYNTSDGWQTFLNIGTKTTEYGGSSRVKGVIPVKGGIETEVLLAAKNPQTGFLRVGIYLHKKTTFNFFRNEVIPFYEKEIRPHGETLFGMASSLLLPKEMDLERYKTIQGLPYSGKKVLLPSGTDGPVWVNTPHGYFDNYTNEEIVAGKHITDKFVLPDYSTR